MMTFLGWIFFSVVAGMFARLHCNRSGVGWFFAAFFFTPMAAFVLLAVLHPLGATAQQTTFRDPSGRSVGTATSSGNQTTFRDANGRSTGTATTDSTGNTVFRDQRGNVTGAASTEKRR